MWKKHKWHIKRVETENKPEKLLLVFEKAHFKPKQARGDELDHYKLIKVTIQQEDIMIGNKYASNIGISNFIKQNLLDTNGQAKIK